MRQESQRLLERFLTGEKLTPEDIDELVSTTVKEDLFLEYKDGKILTDRDSDSKPSDVIREYMSGFANSAGGLLIVGISDSGHSPKEVVGCHGHKKGDLAAWAARCLTPMASYFSPVPRFQVIAHPNGEVLVGGVQRSLALVPRIRAGKLSYHFRLHDQTLEAPDYLVSDLMLGRREIPDLQVSSFAVDTKGVEKDGLHMRVEITIEFILAVENASLPWASEVRAGFIGWGFNTPGAEGFLANYLLASIDAPSELPPGFEQTAFLSHHVYKIDQLEAFEKHPPDWAGVQYQISTANVSPSSSYRMRSAMYLSSRESAPIWFQIDLAVDHDFIVAAMPNKRIAADGGPLKLTRLFGERPVVTWERLS